MHFNRFRYDDPDAGRFISQDPIGLAGRLNLYQYAPNPLNWHEVRGFKAEKVNTGKFGSTRGKSVGMTTADGKTGFRIEYDERSGAHINVFSGKEKGEHYLFEATESSVKRLQRLFDFPSKSWRAK